MRDSYNLIGRRFQDEYNRTPEQYWEDEWNDEHGFPPGAHPEEKRKCFAWRERDDEYYERVHIQVPQQREISNDNELDQGLER